MNVNEADVEVKIETVAQRWLANLKGAASVRVGTVRSRYQVTMNLRQPAHRLPCSRRGGLPHHYYGGIKGLPTADILGDF